MFFQLNSRFFRPLKATLLVWNFEILLKVFWLFSSKLERSIWRNPGSKKEMLIILRCLDVGHNDWLIEVIVLWYLRLRLTLSCLNQWHIVTSCNSWYIGSYASSMCYLFLAIATDIPIGWRRWNILLLAGPIRIIQSALHHQELMHHKKQSKGSLKIWSLLEKL